MLRNSRRSRAERDDGEESSRLKSPRTKIGLFGCSCTKCEMHWSMTVIISEKVAKSSEAGAYVLIARKSVLDDLDLKVAATVRPGTRVEWVTRSRES